MIHVSTDYVFPGDAKQPYDVDDPTGPKGAYGRTKLAGELAVREILPDDSWVVRTAWLYGASGKNIIKTMTRLERERETVSFVADQTGSPTWSHDLASGLLALAGSDAPAGTYHATNRGETTWYGLARAVFEELGADPDRVQPIRTQDYPLPAPRPAYSVLSPHAWDAAGLPPFRGWRAALAEAFATSRDAFRP
jgi:dTDP-4-dehydrorhamnose reductase